MKLESSNVEKEVFLMPSENLVRLNDIREGEPVVLLHPIEGHIEMLKSFPRHINNPVYGIQFTKDAMKYETIEELASFYWSLIDNELKTLGKSKVHLCGYSFGASVTFEMGCQGGEKVFSLSLLDGSHSYVAVHVDSYKNKFNIEEVPQTESEALFTFVQQHVALSGRKEFVDSLISCPNLDARIDLAVKIFIEASLIKTVQPSDVEIAMRSYLNRLLMSYKYKPLKKLSVDKILLIKSSHQNNLAQAKLGDDYGLSKVFEGRIHVQSVSGDHQTFLVCDDGQTVASILKEHMCN